jgi:EAL domain-containing protein (putative c-di-GMP-specific phosphodiesterase class I)
LTREEGTNEICMRAYLEHFREQGGPAERVEITRDPFVIGRSRTADLTIYSHKVSKEHALISQRPGGFLVRDLGSTNGTFVNGKRIAEAILQNGDILHVSHWEFCFWLNESLGIEPGHTASMTQKSPTNEKDSLIRAGHHLHQLVSDGQVTTLYQPIVFLRTGAVLGFEALGRGNHHRLHQSPVKLFELAERCEIASELCRVFRAHALESGDTLPGQLRLFLNIHPSELNNRDFLDHLEELARNNASRRQLVVEISERAVTSVEQMRLIKFRLGQLGIELAYDDFGAGQARLLELVECPPHFLKLDRALVQGMESRQTHRDLVKALLSAVADTGTAVIAEGIETARAAELCRDSGCPLGQGFFFARPAPVYDIVTTLEQRPAGIPRDQARASLRRFG